MQAVTDGREALDRLRTIVQVAGHDSIPAAADSFYGGRSTTLAQRIRAIEHGAGFRITDPDTRPSRQRPAGATSSEKHSRSCASQTTPNQSGTIHSEHRARCRK